MKNIKILTLITIFAISGFVNAQIQKNSKHNWQAAKDLVLQAADYAHKNGNNILLAHINRGGFTVENSYVFMLNTRGFIVAHPYRKDIIGTNNALEKHYIERMLAIIWRYNEGWIEYRFTDPKTGEETPKLSYLKQTSPNTFIGAGVY